MKKWLILPLVLLALSSCNDGAPDVSDIQADLQVVRFEQDFFAIDTNNVAASLEQLRGKYPSFLNDFMVNVLGIPLMNESDSMAVIAIRRFIKDYRPIKDTADKVFSSFDGIAADVRKGLQYVKYYFPEYNAPSRLISFIGPLDAYYESSLGGHSDIITPEGLGAGLQLHLGKKYSVYQSETGQRLFPSYISRRFEPEYIPANCMKNIIDDLFPDRSGDRPLIEQMIEKGKRLYVLDKLLPHTGDTLKIGYTKKQLNGCYENEGNIWNFFLRNNLLYSIDPSLNKNYAQDGPKTEELGDGSPGYIGLFVGWQIVKKYMSDRDMSLRQLMETNNKKIFDESKYKPK
jgi:hypothetical protein